MSSASVKLTVLTPGFLNTQELLLPIFQQSSSNSGYQFDINRVATREECDGVAAHEQCFQ